MSTRTGLTIFLFLVSTISSPLTSQDQKITFSVIVPPSTSRDVAVFIAGNHPDLGNWNPGAVKLRKMNDSLWSFTSFFAHGLGLEFKFTLGTWATQAIYKPGVIPGNERLDVLKDTSITVRPMQWGNVLFHQGKIVGTVRYHRELRGEGLRYSRDLIVWLPPSYSLDTARHYPVLYMHDGQNIFDPATSFLGYDWHVDDVVDSLIRANKIEEIIVVGVYNSPDRIPEYSNSTVGKAYARFLVETVKPFIDGTYRTKPDRNNTAVMGSSMGGLISFLLAWWYPDVFSKAGCLSTAFTIDSLKTYNEVNAYSGLKKNVHLYFDVGSIGGEKTLVPGNERMTQLLQKKGYAPGKDLEYFYDETADHSEMAWAARVWRPLLFMFGGSER